MDRKEYGRIGEAPVRILIYPERQNICRHSLMSKPDMSGDTHQDQRLGGS
jgi:hypothetical protein